MKLTIIESPYAGEIERNVAYARACMAHSLSLGEAPLASHLLYTQPGILDDDIPAERQLGIAAGLAWRHVAEHQAFYIDLGFSRSMQAAMEQAVAEDRLWVVRTLPLGFLPSIMRPGLGPQITAEVARLFPQQSAVLRAVNECFDKRGK